LQYPCHLIFGYTFTMSVAELQIQAKQLSYLEQVELVRLLSSDLQLQKPLETKPKTLSWFGIGESEITDLSERDEELLFQDEPK
jgi:hypothetical protein